MKSVKHDTNEKQKRTEKNKENNPVILNGDTNMKEPVKGLK